MFHSLTSRIAALGFAVAATLIGLLGFLLNASVETSASFNWVSHSQQVIEMIDETVGGLREAESGQRGFLLTHNAAFSTSFDQSVSDAQRDIGTLLRLTADNPGQNARAVALAQVVDQRIAILRSTLMLGRGGRFDQARGVVASGRGRDLMEMVSRRAGEMLQVERTLLDRRIDDTARRVAWNKQLVLFGGVLVTALVILMVIVVTRGIRRPMATIIGAMSKLGENDQQPRIEGTTGSAEFDRLSAGYNRMADRLEGALVRQRDSDAELLTVNAELRDRSEVLQTRGEAIELLGGMAHRMQAARTDEELADIIRVFVPRVLPGTPGALYAHNNSRNALVQLTQWGHPANTPADFSPEGCWGLRRGQSHFVTAPGCDVVCAHVADPLATYHCEPLLAGGEVIGVLYLQGVVAAEHKFHLSVLVENIASALVNHRLQRGLREQTIRDPLTGLFNRRYMEETLAIEIARSQRGKAPLALVMCDVDHFKRFNDEFGHDAGDAVLKAVSAEMRNHFRDGDVVCRYGGEEFTIIAPGATPAKLALRVEKVRAAIAAIDVRHDGQALGRVSMSFGIAGLDEQMGRDGARLVSTADAALYRAKREGRNRLVLANKMAA